MKLTPVYISPTENEESAPSVIVNVYNPTIVCE